MSSYPCVYDPINRELRTVPSFFNNGKAYAGFVRARGVGVGAQVAPGQVLGSLYWIDGTTLPLVVPDGCHGEIESFGHVNEYRIHRRPSQVLLILRP